MIRKCAALCVACFIAMTSWAESPYSIEIAKQPNQKWRFQRLNALNLGETVKVSGRLTANMTSGLPRGHVDIAAYSAEGILLAETTADYSPSLLTHTMKKKGGVRFTGVIQQSLPVDAVIKVAFHRERLMIKPAPSHVENIAR